MLPDWQPDRPDTYGLWNSLAQYFLDLRPSPTAVIEGRSVSC
jgi:hypothetical protein